VWDKARATLGRRLPSAAHFLERRKSSEDMRKILEDIRSELREQRKYLDGFRHVVARDVLQDVEKFAAEHMLSLEQTMQRITDKRLCFARFGDGELRIMLRNEFNLRFQRWSPGIARDLRSVLTFDGFDPDRLLLGFPHPQRGLYWSNVWLDIWPDLKPILSTSVAYGCTHVSRPMFFQHLGEAGVAFWRKVWEGQEVCIVTGEHSRFSLVPDLFDNIKASRFIYSTPVNAYADLPRLMKVLEEDDREQLYLVALGPAGTLVTAWLSRMGRWAIDVGHISNSWENVFAGGKWPERMDVRS
jgi:Glycosyltransferase GT-D fold